MNVIFMGTPEFAVDTLQMLIKKHNVLAVVTQPDKPKGRGKKMIPPVVKEMALENNIDVLQPVSAKAPEFAEELKKYNADIFVVAAYGQILPEEVLNIPKYGSINVHGSLLPLYRGAAPMQRAVMDGCKVTGITIMHMAKGLDCGDMISKREVEITDEDSYGTLGKKSRRPAQSIPRFPASRRSAPPLAPAARATAGPTSSSSSRRWNAWATMTAPSTACTACLLYTSRCV